MDVRATPGQKETRRLATKYGDRLVCVRYRYDKVKCKRYKTIELIVVGCADEGGASFAIDELRDLSPSCELTVVGSVIGAEMRNVRVAAQRPCICGHAGTVAGNMIQVIVRQERGVVEGAHIDS